MSFTPPFLQQYPSPANMDKWAAEVMRIREDDALQISQLPNKFLRGRLVSPERVPTSSADVTEEDVEYDYAFKADGTEMYILLDISGTLTWVRSAAFTTTW